MQLDLAGLASVKKFTKAYLAEERGPDLLILNAGVMACPQSYTKDGFEMQIGKALPTPFFHLYTHLPTCHQAPNMAYVHAEGMLLTIVSKIACNLAQTVIQHQDKATCCGPQAQITLGTSL